MAKPRKDEAATTEAPKATGSVRPTEDPSKPKVLLIHRKGGAYKCAVHYATGGDAGTGVKAMGEFSLVIKPGLNLVSQERFDAAKDNPGFRGRIARREIIVSEQSFYDLDEGTCIEEAKKTANLPTLADLLEGEKRVKVAQALEKALELATRTVRKRHPNMTAIQAARLDPRG